MKCCHPCKLPASFEDFILVPHGTIDEGSVLGEQRERQRKNIRDMAVYVKSTLQDNPLPKFELNDAKRNTIPVQDQFKKP